MFNAHVMKAHGISCLVLVTSAYERLPVGPETLKRKRKANGKKEEKTKGNCKIFYVTRKHKKRSFVYKKNKKSFRH